MSDDKPFSITETPRFVFEIFCKAIAADGKLEALAQEAIAEFKAGHCQEI
ncbi:hypothetical protein NIES4075_14370 [Tolypothrix sp. NIES-4075]|nr:hypothetical protein [Tolypothrix sp. NIES-4075]GAX40471.1 hypothetical protein NIES4075_14370 [Tolypothrix sp. NIES-4075]